MDVTEYIILLLVKKLNEGDGAILPIIDRSFFRIIEDKAIVTKYDNIKLKNRLNEFLEEGLLVLNEKNNYCITKEGENSLIINEHLKKELG